MRSWTKAMLGAAIACSGWTAQAQGFDLVTAADQQQDQAAGEVVRPKAASVGKGPAPQIRVVSPSAAADELQSPLRIELNFLPPEGARIVPGSFRVLYGMLKIDLTERLRPHAAVGERGVVVEQAKVPSGSHRLFLQISDDKGNVGEQELRVKIGS